MEFEKDDYVQLADGTIGVVSFISGSDIYIMVCVGEDRGFLRVGPIDGAIKLESPATDSRHT